MLRSIGERNGMRPPSGRSLTRGPSLPLSLFSFPPACKARARFGWAREAGADPVSRDHQSGAGRITTRLPHSSRTSRGRREGQPCSQLQKNFPITNKDRVMRRRNGTQYFTVYTREGKKIGTQGAAYLCTYHAHSASPPPALGRCYHAESCKKRGRRETFLQLIGAERPLTFNVAVDVS